MKMLKKNKKGLEALGTLGKAVLVFGLLAVLLIWVIPTIKSMIGSASIQQCIKTYDIDADTYLIDDTCLCDPGRLSDQEAYYLKGESDCIIVPLNSEQPEDSQLYVYDNKADVTACNKKADSLMNSFLPRNTVCGGDQAAIDANLRKLARADTGIVDAALGWGSGLSRDCFEAIAAPDPKYNNKPLAERQPLRVCPTSPRECEKKFKESSTCKAE